MEEPIGIDVDEMVDYAVNYARSHGIVVTSEVVNLIFDAEVEFLRSKCVIAE